MRQAALIAISALLIIVAGLIWGLRNHTPIPLPSPTPPPLISADEPSPLISPAAENLTGLPLTLPQGFSISIFAKNLGAPRDLTFDPAGRVLASITSQGTVVALEDADADGVAETTRTVLSGLNAPHGLAFNCTTAPCALYVAETAKVSAYAYDAASAAVTFIKKIADLPAEGGHFTRTLLFLAAPDEHKLLISVGSSCNVCVESDWRRAKILIYDTRTGTLEEFASGLRNAVFMTLHPDTDAIWATEMGRDHLGDDLPPDEINIIKEGKFYGWPFCYGKNIWDRNFVRSAAAESRCRSAEPSYIDIPAHSAPLGLAFISGEGWPQEYRNDLLVAYHGSWNRSVPTGYKIVRYDLDESGKYLGAEDFISGWLTPQGAAGRPVDIIVRPEGILYISDDGANAIYRIVYGSPAKDASGLIRVSEPQPGDAIRSPMKIHGEARGNWFFEASFPIRLLDGNGKEVALNPPYVMTAEDWMTTDFVPFSAEVEFHPPDTTIGTLILAKDNPSGLPEHSAEIRIPVRF